MNDIRTPSRYFTNGSRTNEKLIELKDKLDDLLTALRKLKEKPETTLATHNIIHDEINKITAIKHKKDGLRKAKSILDACIMNDEEKIINGIKEALDIKAHIRIEPDLIETGEEIENRIFWSDIIGNK